MSFEIIKVPNHSKRVWKEVGWCNFCSLAALVGLELRKTSVGLELRKTSSW